MVEELKLAIKIDDATVEQSLLKQFANAQKMADKVVLDFKNVNFDDKQIEAKFKEMQKKAGQNPIDLSISGNTLDMLGQIDKRLTEIFSIGKGKSFIDSSSTVADIGKIENKINELNKKYEEVQKKLSSIGSDNISGKNVNLVDNEEFKKLSQEVSELKNQFDDLKTHMQLLDDYTVPTDRFFELQSQVETTTVKVSDLVEEFAKLSNAQKALSSTPQESNISSGKKDAFPSTEATASIEKLEQVSNANKEVQKAVETSTLAIKENAKAIDNGELPALDELIKKANEAAYELTKGKDIVSQIGKKQVYKVTETDENGKTMERIVGQFSYVEKSLDGQLKNVLATYDESTGRWNEEVLSLATNFEKVGKEIISLDNKINKLEMHRDKMVSEHPNYDTSADDELIDVQKSRRFVLEQTLGLYANEKEYVYEIDAFEKKRIENNRTLLALKEQQNNTQQVKQDKKLETKLNTDWEKAIDFNKEYDETLADTEQRLLNFSIPKELETQWLKLIDYADELRVKLANNEISLPEYKSSINSKISEYNSNVNIQQKRDKETFDTAAKEQENKLLDRQKQIWNDLITSLERYSTIQKRIASNNALSTDNEEATKLLEHIHELQRNDILPTEKLTASNEKLQQINQTVTDLKAKLKESTLDSLQGSIDKYQKIYDQRSTYSSDFAPSEQYTKNLIELNTAIKNLVEYRNTLKNVGEVTVEQETHLKGLVAACEKASDSFKSLSASEKGASQIAVDKLVQRINKDLDECTNYSKEAKLELRALRDELESANPRNLKEITSEIINIENAEIRAGRAGRSFFDTLKNSGFHQLAAQMAGMFGFYDVVNVVKEGIGTIRELDTALTEMRKVSNESVSTLKSYQNTTFDTADVVGTTAKQLQVSTADWMRLGESINDAAESAKDANILFNVSEFDSIDEATESLVSMSQAYKDLGKMDIIDVLNNIGNNYSISTDGLATALKDSASALVTANNDLNEAVALTTAGNAITQDPSKVGAGLRTISLRLVGTQSAKEELESLGEDTTDVITTVSKLRDTIMEATKAATEDGKGFDILDENGNYKSTYEIMQGLADLYDKIVEKDKELGTNNLNLLLETIAGKNRSNIAASILQNGEMLRSVFEDAQNSSGSAENENKAYLESVEGRIKRLQNKIQQFWATLIDSNVVKEGVDFLDAVTSGVTKIVDKVNLIPIAISAIYSVMNNGGGLIRLIINFINNSPFLASVEFSREVYEFI